MDRVSPSQANKNLVEQGPILLWQWSRVEPEARQLQLKNNDQSTILLYDQNISFISQPLQCIAAVLNRISEKSAHLIQQ